MNTFFSIVFLSLAFVMGNNSALADDLSVEAIFSSGTITTVRTKYLSIGIEGAAAGEILKKLKESIPAKDEYIQDVYTGKNIECTVQKLLDNAAYCTLTVDSFGQITPEYHGGTKPGVTVGN